jgi:hypothetical protein
MPWHYRYVGVDVATAIYNAKDTHDETFEEYYKSKQLRVLPFSCFFA